MIRSRLSSRLAFLVLALGLFSFAAACGGEPAPDGASADSAAAAADSAEAASVAGGGAPADTASGQAAPPADSARVTVRNFKYSQLPSGTRVFSGTLVNHTARRIAFAQVQVSLLDGDNQRVSTASIEVRDIPPNDSMPFQQPLDSDEPFQAARVRSVLLP